MEGFSSRITTQLQAGFACARQLPSETRQKPRLKPGPSEAIRTYPKPSEVKKQPTNPTIQCSAMPPTHPPDPPPKPIDTEQSSWFSRPPLNTWRSPAFHLSRLHPT